MVNTAVVLAWHLREHFRVKQYLICTLRQQVLIVLMLEEQRARVIRDRHLSTMPVELMEVDHRV
jgi:CRISPR/Cas system-associated exonuclease Cas4 (RecB family)